MVIDGEHWFVGYLAEESLDRRGMASESKLHPETRALFLTALALVASGGPASITTGIPVSQHTPENKLLFGAMVRGRHSVKVNGQEKIFTIDTVHVVPEGAGAWWDAALTDQGRIASPALIGQPVTRIWTWDLGQ